jgi:hypothetical protein
MTATLARYVTRTEPPPTTDTLIRHVLTGGPDADLETYLEARPKLRRSLEKLVAGVRADFQTIRFAAFLKYEARVRYRTGPAHGRDVNDWLEAEMELCRTAQGAAGRPAVRLRA